MATVAAWLRDCWHREDVPVSLQITPPDEARPPVPAAYMPLYTYLDRRYAAHGGPDVRTDRGVARIRAAVTSVRRCGVVDGPLWGERSPHRCMDRRASQRSPATECANRGV